MKARITKRVVDKLQVPEPGGRSRIYDDKLTGFGAVRYPSGKTSFFIEYGPRGQQRRMMIGQYGALDVEKARTKARALLGKVDAGEDPLEEKQQDRSVPTWAGWVDEYLKTVEGRKKRPEVDRYYLKGTRGGREREGEPKASLAMTSWRRRSIAKIAQRDVERLMQQIADESGKTSANRWLASVRACFAAAVRARLIVANPAEHVKKMQENPPRNRVLTDQELERLVTKVRKLPDKSAQVLFFMLLATGCRKSEALRAKWEDFDLEAGVWTIPSPKAGYPQSLPLARSTAGLLRDLPRTSPWVFPSPRRSTRGHRTEIRNAWQKLAKAAKIENVTIHDIRRTYGLTVAKQAGILAASKMLRHSDTRITSRVYAPLCVEDLRDVAEAVAARQNGKVVPFRGGKKRSAR